MRLPVRLFSFFALVALLKESAKPFDGVDFGLGCGSETIAGSLSKELAERQPFKSGGPAKFLPFDLADHDLNSAHHSIAFSSTRMRAASPSPPLVR